MVSLSTLNPTPYLPPYSGPLKVGSRAFEFSIASLRSQSAASAPLEAISTDGITPSIPTVSFRLFYPCPDGQMKKKLEHPTWLPEPRGEYLRAYYRFMRASPWLATVLSHMPFLNLIQHTQMPAIKDAPLLSPAASSLKRWPVLVFSHGLAGTSRAYSQLLGSLASHGIVVAAIDHRDGSAPIAFLKPDDGKTVLAPIEYKQIPHAETPEVDAARQDQLKIRMWELAMLHEALLRLDGGTSPTNLADTTNTTISADSGKDWRNVLDVQRAGGIAWAGHSFGAATIVQFVKSIFYHDETLLKLPSTSPLANQVQPSSPVILLDLWGMPLKSASTRNLWSLPLPAYSLRTKPSSLAGSDVSQTEVARPLAILSEGFFKWKANFETTCAVVSPPSSVADAVPGIEPHIFYPIAAAHLSQSDFGILFPYITGRLTQAKEPERALQLNMRAILESLRQSGMTLSATAESSLEMSAPSEKQERQTGRLDPSKGKFEQHLLGQDHLILGKDDKVRGWVFVDWRDGANGKHKVQTRQESHKHGTDGVPFKTVGDPKILESKGIKA